MVNPATCAREAVAALAGVLAAATASTHIDTGSGNGGSSVDAARLTMAMERQCQMHNAADNMSLLVVADSDLCKSPVETGCGVRIGLPAPGVV